MKNTIFKQIIFAASLLTIILANTSCNDPSAIGGEVVDPDRPDVTFTDTLSIFASSVEVDSVRTYNSLGLLTTYLCGNLDDPIFGKSEAVINTQLRLTGTLDSNILAGIPSGKTKLDSVIIVLRYDTASFYGNVNTNQDLSVFLLDEDMDNNVEYYSSDDFAPSRLLASATIDPSKNDSIFSVINSVGDTIFPPQVRLVVDNNDELFQDFLFKDGPTSYPYYQDDASFLELVKGIKIRVDENTSTDLMMGFNLTSTIAGMYIYYTDSALVSGSYQFLVNNNAAQMVHFEHDYVGSEAELAIDNETEGNNLFFIQGMSGLNAKFRIPYAQNLQNAIVNQAQLELTVATMLPDDEAVFHDDPISQLLISKINSDGELAVINDVQAALNNSSLTGVFGGNLIEVNGNTMVLRKYKMNISAHLQDLINGVETSDEIFINAISKAQNANRSIIFGPNHPTYPAKINLTYTFNQ